MSKKITNFALKPDENTINQFNSCCNEEFVVKASLMPDAHSGYVAPIGSVLVTKDVVVPAWVGYDIGCGVIACKLKKNDIVSDIENHKNEIFSKVNEIVPMGVGAIGVHGDVLNKHRIKYRELIDEFKKGDYNKDILKFLSTQAEAHLGSLGSGNHFIELGAEKGVEDEAWIIVHSGSRGIGRQVATHYMKQASGDSDNFEKTSTLDVNSKQGREYLNVLNFGLEFALLNRLEIASRVCSALSYYIGEDISFDLWTNKNHNHVILDEEYYVHRKGATPAKKEERGVIPANMRDGCFLVKGLGNKEFLESSSHGAGRVMSRREAKKNLSLGDFKKSMSGIIGKIDNDTLDEAPEVYKNIYDVMEAQKLSVEILRHIKPLINWKG